MMKRNVFLTVILCVFAITNADAAVVQRNSRVSISRAPSVAAKSVQTNTAPAEEYVEPDIIESDIIEPEVVKEPVIIENKASRFDESLDDALSTNSDMAGTDLAEKIRAQRAALDAADNVATNRATGVSGKNTCDTGLRDCMTQKCGNNFAKCASDTDTTFGGKLDSCRRDLKCNANEFKLFSAEIKADRNAAIKLKSFNDIIDCGERYDKCIVAECGTTYSKCLGKSAGDTAISKCGTIAKNCSAMDSGLASRTMSVFGTLRQGAEKQISADEKKLYALRDQMKSVCSRLGAMFDERSLDCVYTVNFFAGDTSTLYASKKAYAGSTFDCTPNWFGVDVTTFKENAYRETRAQTAASSAMLGSGVGMGVGAITSGAITNAIKSQKAANAAKEAECSRQPNKKWSSFWGKCVNDNSTEKAEKQQQRIQNREQKKAERQSAAAQRQADRQQQHADNDAATKQKHCNRSGGTWANNTCSCPGNTEPKSSGKCPKTDSEQKVACEQSGGSWTLGRCRCKRGFELDDDTDKCTEKTTIVADNTSTTSQNDQTIVNDDTDSDNTKTTIVADNTSTTSQNDQTIVNDDTDSDNTKDKEKQLQQCKMNVMMENMDAENDPEFQNIYAEILQGYQTGTNSGTIDGQCTGGVSWRCTDGQPYKECMSQAAMECRSYFEAQDAFEQKKLQEKCPDLLS